MQFASYTKADGAYTLLLPNSWGPFFLTVIFPTNVTVKWLVKSREGR